MKTGSHVWNGFWLAGPVLVGCGQWGLWTPIEAFGWGWYLLPGETTGEGQTVSTGRHVLVWATVGGILTAGLTPVILANSPQIPAASGLWLGVWSLWTLSLLFPFLLQKGVGTRWGTPAGWCGVALGAWLRFYAAGFHWTGPPLWNATDWLWAGAPLLVLWGWGHVRRRLPPSAPARVAGYGLGLVLLAGLIPDSSITGSLVSMTTADMSRPGPAVPPVWLIAVESRGQGGSPPDWSPALCSRLDREITSTLWWVARLTGTEVHEGEGAEARPWLLVTPEWGTRAPQVRSGGLLLAPVYALENGQMSVWVTWWGAGPGGVWSGQRLKCMLTPVGERPCWTVQTYPVRYRQGKDSPVALFWAGRFVMPLLCVEALDQSNWRETAGLMTVSANWQRLTGREKRHFRKQLARLAQRYGKPVLLSVHAGQGGFWTPEGEQLPIFVSRPVRDEQQGLELRLLVYASPVRQENP